LAWAKGKPRWRGEIHLSGQSPSFQGKMMDHTQKVLEFDKIRGFLSQRATSPLGRELAQRIVPLRGKDLIERRLDTILQLKEVAPDFPWGGLLDTRSSLRRLRRRGTFLEPKDLLQILSNLKLCWDLLRFSQGCEKICPELSSLLKGFHPHKEIISSIERAVEPNGEITDSASPQLSLIRKRIRVIKGRLKDKLASIMTSSLGRNILQEPFVTLRDGRFVLPVKQEEKGRMKGVIHDRSASGATLFIEPLTAVNMNNQLRELLSEEKGEEERILRELADNLRAKLDELEEELGLLGEIDLLWAAAQLAIDLKAERPDLGKGGNLKLVQARHPLLILGEKGPVVPLSLTLGENRVLLITGPNAGGKTVALKTVGLLALMVQSGLLVPAKAESHFPLFTKIFADIGDEQSIEKSLSSFSSHIQNLVEVLNGVGAHTLSLLDELGGDTDPKEGSALGEAVLEALAQRGGMVVATTHHTPLKAFVHQHPLMENGSMEFDESTLQPTYRFRAQVPGRSYGLEICRRMGMPQEVTQRAAARLGKGVFRLEGLIADLDRTTRRMKEEQEAWEVKEKEASRLLTLYEERLTGAKEEAKRIREEARREAQTLLSQTNRRVEHLIAELKGRKAERSAILQVKRELKQAKEKLSPQLPPLPQEEEIKVGDLVRLGTLSAQGRVQSILGGGRANVRVGRANIITPLTELRRSEEPEEDRPRPGVRYNLPSQVRLEIDLRGQTAEEAQERIDKYLDEALLAGLERVRIIHGKGTGALRRKIASYLEDHPMVKSARLGELGEGGSGVTVVELKT